MRNAAPRRRPSLEALEARHLPATFGLPWPDPQHLTLSFMPDGTSVAGVPSTLNKSLSARMPVSAWQSDVLRAFQSFAALGNINISLVSDNGQAPGRPGPLQGNPGFGDIRVGAIPLSPNTLALATPFDAGNNWSGDVLLNSLAAFGDGPQAAEDLYNALLHEAGHALGLPDNPSDPGSVMFTSDTGTHTAPSAADAAAIRALYGARTADTRGNSGAAGPGTRTPEDSRSGDDSGVAPASPRSGQATELKPQTPGTDARWPYLVRGNLASPVQGVNYDLQAAPTPAGAMLVTVWGNQPGGLDPVVTVFDARHNPVSARVVSRDTASETVQVLSPTPGAHYVVGVSAANPSGARPQGTGGYTLAIAFPHTPLATDVLTSGALGGSHNETFLALNVTNTEVFHFDLSADTDSSTAVTLTVFDAAGKPVEYLRAIGGAGASAGEVVLPSGKYTVRILGATRTGGLLPTVHYTLNGTNRSDPIGPAPIDPTLNPSGTPPDATPEIPLFDVVLLPDLIFGDFLLLSDPFHDVLWY